MCGDMPRPAGKALACSTSVCLKSARTEAEMI